MLAQLGKPYQSSKGRPGGGLGLFLVVNVARTLGGSVSARNRPEGGAAVTLRLPLAAITLEENEPWKLSERLLLIVEDDAAFARTLSRSFERRGYQVLRGRQRRAGGGAAEGAFARLCGGRPQADGRRLGPGLRADAAPARRRRC